MKIFMATAVACIILASCGISNKSIEGDGNVISKDYPVQSFHSLMAMGAMEIHLSSDVTNKLRIETDSNLIEHIDQKLENGALQLSEAKGVNLKPTKKILVYVSAPLYKSIEISGSCELITNAPILGGEPLSIKASGASSMNLAVSLPRVAIELSGSNELAITGVAKDFVLTSSGSCKANCVDLATETTTVDISGAGEARVAASKTLTVNASGAAEVLYKGDPEVKKDVSGAAKVQKL